MSLRQLYFLLAVGFVVVASLAVDEHVYDREAATELDKIVGEVKLVQNIANATEQKPIQLGHVKIWSMAYLSSTMEADRRVQLARATDRFTSSRLLIAQVDGVVFATVVVETDNMRSGCQQLLYKLFRTHFNTVKDLRRTMGLMS